MAPVFQAARKAFRGPGRLLRGPGRLLSGARNRRGRWRTLLGLPRSQACRTPSFRRRRQESRVTVTAFREKWRTGNVVFPGEGNAPFPLFQRAEEEGRWRSLLSRRIESGERRVPCSPDEVENGERRLPSFPELGRRGKTLFPPFRITPRGGNVPFPPLPQPEKQGRARSLLSRASEPSERSQDNLLG